MSAAAIEAFPDRDIAVLSPEELAASSGLDLMRRMIRGELPSPPIARTLNFGLVEADKGHAVFAGLPLRDHYNPIGSIHGGWHATLLDSAMGCAIHTLLEPGQAYTTLEIKINFVRALTDTTGPVRVEGRVIASTRQTATSEARLVDANGRLYSHGTTTCLIFPARVPGAPRS